MSDPTSPLRSRLFVGLQYLLPQHLLSRIVLRLTRVRLSFFKNALIGGFLRCLSLSLSRSLLILGLAFGFFASGLSRIGGFTVLLFARRRVSARR